MPNMASSTGASATGTDCCTALHGGQFIFSSRSAETAAVGPGKSWTVREPARSTKQLALLPMAATLSQT